MARSLRGELLGWLLIPLAMVVAFNSWTTNRSAFRMASLVTDRTLLASARVIAEQIKEYDGSIEAVIPPSSLEMFASPDRDRVIYRVTSPSGELIAGYPDVVMPPEPLTDLQPVFFDAQLHSENIRSVAIVQPVVSKSAGGNALVVLGTTLNGRDRLVTELWLKSLRDQVLLVGVAALLALFGLRRGLSPLMKLGAELAERDSSTLKPLQAANIQIELTPLIDALNQAFAKIQSYIDLQRRFIANASHQLRTPLTVLKTQTTVGLRDLNPAAKDESLGAIDRGLDALTRLVNQLLTLARVEPGGSALHKDNVNFAAITRMALEGLATIALDREIELVFDIKTDSIYVLGHSVLLREMVVNLVENALRYTPRCGTIVVRVKHHDRHVTFGVEDTGPGIPENEREKVFERFYRIPESSSQGIGLGLAIVREIVLAHDGSIGLSGAAPHGLHVEVTLPAEPAPTAQGASSVAGTDEPTQPRVIAALG
jgi:two-component system, OmpR family, sensor histidine kinase TctE